ncbi:protein of unknown function [Oenococcus oeni]|uniref:Uncharacterized protein n=1 Tax=Oenococcus oeni TaxID=1247 RepID=A0AAQ2ZFT1_OENOE|nr:protein of unknown function [Oenococcus oeni]
MSLPSPSLSNNLLLYAIIAEDRAYNKHMFVKFNKNAKTFV